MGQEKKVLYQEDFSKYNNGGLNHANYKAETATIFSTGGSHCQFEITEKYLENISQKSESLRPRENESEENWFRKQAIGENTSASIILNIAKNAGWDTTKLWRGHSLSTFAYTTLYEHGFDNNCVKKFTGQRSDFAVREYWRSEQRKRQTSEILSRPTKEAHTTLSQEDIIKEDEEL